MNNLARLEYIIVLVDNRVPSFCYYKNTVTNSEKFEQMSFSDFEAIVKFATENGYKLTILQGKENLPDSFLQILKPFEHATIKPYLKKDPNSNTIYIIDYDGDDSVFSELTPGGESNILLRLKSDHISDLILIVKKYSKCFHRLNLFITDIESLTDKISTEYENQLRAVKEILYEYYLLGNHIELNFLTDRMLLDQMNNCDAGIKHITFAPNGKFYLCPGFYYDNEDDIIGTIETGIEIKNSQLLNLENAPVCNICDAFHCKRCIFLNKKTTLELNTPSKMQCVLSHLERNMSKKLSDSLRKNSQFAELRYLKDIDYLDPFDLVKLNSQLKRGWQLTESIINTDYETLNDRELLVKIFKMQIKILNHLKTQQL